MRKYGVMKETAKKWTKMLEEYKLTDEYRIEKLEMERELKDIISYGEPTTWFDNELLKKIKEYDRTNFK